MTHAAVEPDVRLARGIVVSCRGKNTSNLNETGAAQSSTEGQETVSVVVHRDGGAVTLQVRPGRLGIFGRGVEKKDE